jgi:hypothetical protein
MLNVERLNAEKKTPVLNPRWMNREIAKRLPAATAMRLRVHYCGARFGE